MVAVYARNAEFDSVVVRLQRMYLGMKWFFVSGWRRGGEGE